LASRAAQEAALGGQSQGGGQSMLRFLRSEQPLGGWIGSVCHAPVAPHTPRAQDPLLVGDSKPANRDRPIRLLAGEVDTVFPPSLVNRDAERLRVQGGFTDVVVEVSKGMAHSKDPDEEDETHPDLDHIRRSLAAMIGTTPRRLVRRPAADAPVGADHALSKGRDVKNLVAFQSSYDTWRPECCAHF